MTGASRSIRRRTERDSGEPLARACATSSERWRAPDGEAHGRRTSGSTRPRFGWRKALKRLNPKRASGPDAAPRVRLAGNGLRTCAMP
jgi:hypothetical protein